MFQHTLVAVSRNMCLDSHSYSGVFLAARATQNLCYQGELDTWNEGKMYFSPFRLWLEITSSPVFSLSVITMSVNSTCKTNVSF